ncbi:MAG TPA: MBL fold metallo-hydrolase [bacterium]|nr:MBL fold metallo-hydrolase [bacterium]
MQDFKITTLCCNTVMTSAGLLAEHGQSFLIETPDSQVLFDAGQSDVTVRNAKLMGKDLSRTEFVVLSHGHYDHAGGLNAVLDAGIKFKLVLHPDAWQEKLALTPDGVRPIGISPVIREKISAAGIEIIETNEPFEVLPGIKTTGEVPMNNEFEVIEPMLMVKGESGPVPDPLNDDLSLIVSTDKGTVLLLGCAHRGTVNHMRRTAEITGESNFFAVIGGMHLERAQQAQIDATAAALTEFDVKSIVPSHCTGPRATAALMMKFPEKAFPNFVTYSIAG